MNRDGPYRWGDRIDQVVRHHARLTPDAVALRQGQVRISYAELVRRADRVAANLRGHGVVAGDFVPVCLPRSPELVACLLGVLTAGAAYIAVDPQWPLERRREVIRSSRASLVVTAAGDPGGPARALPASAVLVETAAQPPDPDPSADGYAAACVFYTSGTTGTPKGAISPHRGTVRVLVGSATIPLAAETVFLQAAPLPWDGLSLELWAPLLNGGQCVLRPSGDDPLDVAALRDALAAGVNSMWMTSSLFDLFVEEDVDLLGRLRLLLIGGERASPAHARRLLTRWPHIHLVNGYGPAESTIFATTHVVTAEDVVPEASDIPIGRPVAATTVTLRDEDLRKVPAGSVGELTVAGDGLALGYLNDPTETRRRFPVIDGVRHYLTGDLAVTDTRGILRYRGRADRQFKVNGVRIEPEEIESVLTRHPDVTGAHATRLFTATGQPTVAVLYTSRTGEPLERAALRAFLAEHLVPAVLPRVLVWARLLPLRNNGKVDGAAAAELLDRALRDGHGDEPESRAADDDLEQVRRLLGIPRLAATDDIFAGGASSLDAVRLAARASRWWGRRISVGDIYRLRTVDRLRGVEVIAEVEPATPDVHGVLSHAQTRFWLAEATAPGEADNMVVLAYEWSGPLDPKAFAAAVHDVVQHHAALRTVYRFEEDGLRQRTVDPERCAVPIRWEESSHGAEADIRQLVQRLTAGLWTEPFDLENELPARVRVHQVAPDRHLVCLHLHHVSFDGWSESILLADLTDAYLARRSGAAPQLATSSWDFATFAAWEHVRLPGWLRSELPYWRTTLARSPAPVLPRPGQSGEGTRLESTIKVLPEQVRELGAAARRHDSPSAAALLAVSARAISRTFGADDVCLGTVSTGRPVADIESTVGFFVNPLAVPLYGTGQGPLDVLLRQIAGRLTGALAHDRTPFDELVRALRPERGRHPWFQAWAVVQQRSSARVVGPDVTVRPVRVVPPRTSIELMFEAIPDELGGWELVVLRRTDGMSPEQGATLVRHTADAIAELCGSNVQPDAPSGTGGVTRSGEQGGVPSGKY